MTYRFMSKRLLQAGACCFLALVLGSCGGGNDSSSDAGLAPSNFMPQECASATVGITVPADAQGQESYSITVVCQGGGNDLYAGSITGGSIKENGKTTTVDSGDWSQLQRASYNQFNGLRFRCERANFALVDMNVSIQTRDNYDNGVPAKLQGQAITGILQVRENESAPIQRYPIVGCPVTIEYEKAGSAPTPEDKQAD